MRIRVYYDVSPLSCVVLLLSYVVFSHLGYTLNHHRSTDTLRDTPCVKCRLLVSKMRAFVLSKVKVTRLGFEDAGVTPLPTRFRNFLDEALKANALCLVLTPSRL